MKALMFVLAFGTVVTCGCVATVPPPKISSMYTATGAPTPRPDSALVEVFMKASPPNRTYDVVGQVEIETERESRTLENMLGYARIEARRLGGDALVGLETNATPTPAGSSSTYPVVNLYTGEVMGYRTTAAQPGTRRVMKALIVRWREGDSQAANP